MESLELLHVKHWQPLSSLGITHPFFDLNAPTLIFTWIALLLLAIILLLLRYLLRKKGHPLHFALISGLASFAQFVTQTLGVFSFGHFSFVAALFVFIVMANTLSIFPWLEEPTQDLNTTFALGIISFLYIQYQALMTHGWHAYIKEYFQPFFIMFPLHVVGKIATVISISFRLFGNIFGGAVISTLYFSMLQGSFILQTLGLISGLNLTVTIFFGIFEGLLQAFVFSMLTLTYLSIALHEESPDTQGIMV